MATDKTQIWAGSMLGKIQRDELLGRINVASNRVYRYRADDEPEPAAITASRKKIAAYEKSEQVKLNKRYQGSKAATVKARHAVLFADSQKSAIAAVEAIEALSRKNGWNKGD